MNYDFIYKNEILQIKSDEKEGFLPTKKNDVYRYVRLKGLFANTYEPAEMTDPAIQLYAGHIAAYWRKCGLIRQEISPSDGS